MRVLLNSPTRPMGTYVGPGRCLGLNIIVGVFLVIYHQRTVGVDTSSTDFGRDNFLRHFTFAWNWIIREVYLFFILNVLILHRFEDPCAKHIFIRHLWRVKIWNYMFWKDLHYFKSIERVGSWIGDSYQCSKIRSSVEIKRHFFNLISHCLRWY